MDVPSPHMVSFIVVGSEFLNILPARSLLYPKYSLKLPAILFLNPKTNTRIRQSSITLAMEVAMAAPATPMAGAPNLPNISA